MPQDTSQVRVGVTGDIYVAPLGTTVPVDVGAWPAGWVNLGLLDEDAPADMMPTRDITDIRAWQRLLPVRSVRTSEVMQYSFTLIQKSGTNLKLAFGGGAVAALGGGIFRFTPPAASFIDERMVGIEVVDGSIIDRYIARRAYLMDIGTVSFRKDQAVAFPLTMMVLEPASGERWEIISNDAAMAS